ncbi:DNA modification system-associated small protein [Bhargavaea massiliensis]|uniref:DNA modification system-associated small protein n=1 Tax=Bhargavaea massiliensis TaxID=2697500 RepID=UPI003AF45CDD
MVRLRDREVFLLHSICKKNKVPAELMKQLLKEASKNSYENKSKKERTLEYRKLISYYNNEEK